MTSSVLYFPVLSEFLVVFCMGGSKAESVLYFLYINVHYHGNHFFHRIVAIPMYNKSVKGQFGLGVKILSFPLGL